MVRKIASLILFLSISASAQFDRGSLRIGGSFSYERDYWKNELVRSVLDIKPQCGYFI